jgi:GAF domain-containing protein
MRHNPDRLATLRRLMILDSSPEQAFDDIANVLAAGLEVPITMVNLLDESRDWFKARVGFAGCESPSATSFCQVMFRLPDAVVVVPDTTLDPRFSSNPFVTGEPHIRFYAAARLTIAGEIMGTICAYDFKPRELTTPQIDQMKVLAQAATTLLEQRLMNPPTGV